MSVSSRELMDKGLKAKAKKILRDEARGVMDAKDKARYARLDAKERIAAMAAVTASMTSELGFDPAKVWEDVYNNSTVAMSIAMRKANIAGQVDLAGLTSRDKMLMVQDFLATAFLTPEIGIRFVAAIAKDPIAYARIIATILPREMTVDVTERKGVVLLPVHADSMAVWIAENRPKHAIVDVTP